MKTALASEQPFANARCGFKCSHKYGRTSLVVDPTLQVAMPLLPPPRWAAIGLMCAAACTISMPAGERVHECDVVADCHCPNDGPAKATHWLAPRVPHQLLDAGAGGDPAARVCYVAAGATMLASFGCMPCAGLLFEWRLPDGPLPQRRAPPSTPFGRS